MPDSTPPNKPVEDSSPKGERQLGPFILKEKLGVGGMGVVYRAIYPKENREVALKLLPASAKDDDKLIARFEREMEILRKLKHPHIVPCYGGGQLQGQRWMAMQLLPGGTIADILKKQGKLPWQEVVKWGVALCSALQYAHEAGIIHRDLKPSNLLIDKSGKLKLADFGIARDTDATGLTATGRTVGTFAYMSPEQVRGFPPADAKSDIYALGCVLFELLTGKPPFSGSSAPEIMYAHIEKDPPRVTSIALDCPAYLDSLILKCLAKKPEDRPFSAEAIEIALKQVEQKAAEQTSMTQQIAEGQAQGLDGAASTQAARGLLKSKKKKRNRDAGRPFYERTPFLATALALIVAVVIWTLWPLNEDQMVERARVMMESTDPILWDRALTQYLEPLQSKYPESKHSAQIQEWVDRIEMHKAEEKLKYKLKLGREFGSEGERLYAKARQYEQFGDQITALEKYQAIVTLMEKTESARVFVNLARRQIAAINNSGADHTDRKKLVNDSLERADALNRDGNTLAAREVWQSIVRLYGDNQELQPLVAKAQAQLEDK